WASKFFGMSGNPSSTSPSKGQAAQQSGGGTNPLDLQVLREFKNNAYKWLSQAGLLEMFAKQQEAYIYKMMEKFERGDWEEALKWGISLGKPEDHGDLSIGMPLPREALNILLGDGTRSSMLISGPDLHDRLRSLYRSAYEHLAARGDIDK